MKESRGGQAGGRILAAVLASMLAVCVSVFYGQTSPAAFAQGVKINKGPYLQDVTTDSAIVAWEGAESHSGSVKYGPTPEYGSETPTYHQAKTHFVQLVALKPYTLYHYQVWSERAPLSPDSTFRTMAAPGQESINFVAWGDTRTNHTIHRQLATIIADAAPEFVVNIGDLVERGDVMEDWDTFFDIEKELMARTPVYSALGNHERNSPLYFALFALPGNERWYSFDSGPAHFVALDVVFSSYQPGSEQYVWLEQDLKETTRPWKMVYFHYPPYSFSRARPGYENVRSALSPLFEKYGVQMVFSGDAHNYQHNSANGVTYVVTGGGGAPLIPPAAPGPLTVYSEMTYHFLKIQIDGSVLSSTGVRPDGTQFDAFYLKLPTARTGQDQSSLTPIASGQAAVTPALATHEPAPTMTRGPVVDDPAPFGVLHQYRRYILTGAIAMVLALSVFFARRSNPR